MPIPDLTPSLTSFGSPCWSFRSPDLACLLAQCNVAHGFRRRVVLTASFWDTRSDDGVTAIPVSDALPGITPAVFAEAVAAATSSAMGSEYRAAVDEVLERHGVGGLGRRSNKRRGA